MKIDFNSWLDEQEREDDEVLEALIEELASSSDEEEDKRPWGGSKKGKAPNKNRDFASAYAKLVKDYFNGADSIYDERDFELRYRMPRSVFSVIYDRINGQGEFVEAKDCIGKPGIHPLVRISACLRYLCYGCATDREDENMRIGSSTLNKAVRDFCRLMIKEFGCVYLNRTPTEEEKKKIFAANEVEGFPGCLASWDCKHFVWHKCPMRWAGQYAGHAEGGKKTLILEAIADLNRYIWYANFGDAGALNDINVLDKSSIVGALLDGSLDITCPKYTINGRDRDWFYFLVDGIYPEWSIFVKTYSNPSDKKAATFAAKQEGRRKDVECAFGILVKKFHILARPLRNWYVGDIQNLLYTCVILHNMVIAAKGGKDIILQESEAYEEVRSRKRSKRHCWPLFGGNGMTNDVLELDNVDVFAARVGMFSTKMQSAREHYKLKNDLKEHIWNRYGGND